MVITHRTLLIPIEVRVGCVDVKVFQAARISDEALEGAHSDIGCHKLDHFLNYLTKHGAAIINYTTDTHTTSI